MYMKFSVDEVLGCVDRIPTMQSAKHDFDRVFPLRDNMKMTTKQTLLMIEKIPVTWIM